MLRQLFNHDGMKNLSELSVSVSFTIRVTCLDPFLYMCCRPKPPDGRRQATREPRGSEPLSVGPAARTRPEVGVCWTCHLTYT
jgi:hypothetical protein